MTKTILDKIVADKRVTLANLKRQTPLSAFRRDLTPSDRSFYEALGRRGPCYILECKRASPSKGLLRENFDLEGIAKVYAKWANVISVLTDSKYFQGRMSYIGRVRSQVTQPVLCKDFIVDDYQIYLARHFGADAVLLMLSVLTDDEYNRLASTAHSLNMGILTETSNELEVQRAIQLKAKVIGINNRDLRDLSIDLNRSKLLAPQIPAERVIISESGIAQHAHVRELGKYVHGFLIGSSLMQQDNLHSAVADLVLGVNKLCGITRTQDALAAYQAGIHYGGLVFSRGSARRVEQQQARELVSEVPLKWVGVFEDDNITTIADYAARFNLSAVQLQGSETPQYVNSLKSVLPGSAQIWKAHKRSDAAPQLSQWEVDRHLLDAGVERHHRAKAKFADWTAISRRDLSKVLFGGDIDVDNAATIANTGCAGLDFNAGLEHKPGIKSVSAITAAMQSLRYF